MIFAIETSCDDTCAAVLTREGRLLSNIVSSQHELHEPFQGVVPELASRRHCENINLVLKEALREAGVEWGDLDAVGVTRGPGLIGSLLTGIAAAKSISARFDLPLIPVNHIEAHIYSFQLEHELEYPFISLVASGGHTALFRVEGPRRYEVLGHTRDDAVGEAYDKVAKMLDLGYPGGPRIEAAARDGDPEAFDFPRPTLRGSKRWSWQIEDYDFSFSGVKTAVYYQLDDTPDAPRADVSASFQRAVNDCLVYKTLRAAREESVKRVCVGGGVAANTALRESFRRRTDGSDLTVVFPSPANCTDNAAMVAHRARQIDRRADLSLNALPSLSQFSPGPDRSEATVS